MENKRQVETLDFLKMVERMIRASSLRVGKGDEAELAAFASLRVLLEESITSAIQVQLSEGKSWASIGLGLGTTRQGAFRRYGK